MLLSAVFFGSPMLPWDFVESMVEELSRRHMNLNYISLHLYPYEPPKDAGRHHLILSTDPDFFLNYIRKFRKIYANYFLEPLPIYVTYLQNETAPCPWTNDSAFMAPFLFKTYTELYRDVANIAYSAFSDIIYKNNSDNPYFSGGNGIITFHGIKKPSYFALFMLSKTPDRIFYHHKNAFITSMDENTCQILMYNYVHYTAAHCLNSQEQYPVYQIYEKLQSGNIIEFSFDFSQWPEGSYRIQKFILGPKHGSVLDEFIRLGIHDDMLPIELDYLDRNAGMDISVEYIHVDRGNPPDRPACSFGNMCLCGLSYFMIQVCPSFFVMFSQLNAMPARLRFAHPAATGAVCFYIILHSHAIRTKQSFVLMRAAPYIFMLKKARTSFQLVRAFLP